VVTQVGGQMQNVPRQLRLLIPLCGMVGTALRSLCPRYQSSTNYDLDSESLYSAWCNIFAPAARSGSPLTPSYGGEYQLAAQEVDGAHP